LRETTHEPILSYITDIHFPVRWQYDIYRGLEYLASIKYPLHDNMKDALNILINKFNNGLLPSGPKFSGKTHFKLDKDVCIKINTIRGLSILKIYDESLYNQYINLSI
jgi:hypothetical protein